MVSINYLLIEALRRHYRYYGDTLKVEVQPVPG
jgi:hypothetical protein